jgi:hypothetical protein
MLIYQEAAIEEIKIGDLVEVEQDGIHLGAKVVARDLERGALAVVLYSYAEPSENGSGFVMNPCRSDVLTVTPGKGGVKVQKAVDSDAAVTQLLTWERIGELEPKVLGLLKEIKAERPHQGNYLWIWGSYKQRLSELVGWDREAATHPVLRSCAAYNVVYRKLLNNLSDPESSTASTR